MKRTYSHAHLSQRSQVSSKKPIKRSRRNPPSFNISRQEKKFHDIIQNVQTVTNTGVIYALSATLARGTTSITRIGKEVQINSLLIRYALVHGDTLNQMRVTIFQYNRPGTPSISDIYQDTLTNECLSALNRDNGDFIVVLHDANYDMTQDANPQQTTKKYIKLNNTIAQWNESDISDRGNIYMAVVSDSVAITHPTIEFNSRIRYYG